MARALRRWLAARGGTWPVASLRAMLVLAVLLAAVDAWPTGWNDYVLPIEPGYHVIRANSFEICLARDDGYALICPDPQSRDFGPMAAYARTATHIFTRHEGVRPCPENPQLPCGDPDQSFFFVLGKRTDTYVGPLDPVAFDAQLRSLGSPQLSWQTPTNPNILRPLLGALWFLTIAVFLIGWPLGVPGWPLGAVLVIYLLWRWRRRPRVRGSASGGQAV